jgi:hypothetical protein
MVISFKILRKRPHLPEKSYNEYNEKKKPKWAPYKPTATLLQPVTQLP